MFVFDPMQWLNEAKNKGMIKLAFAGREHNGLEEIERFKQYLKWLAIWMMARTKYLVNVSGK